MATRILFVCTGNTCRSPMAEVLAQARDISAESAGVAAQHGDRAAPFAARALHIARGYSLDNHVPRSVEDVDLSTVDQVVAMDPSVAQQLRSDYDDVEGRLVVWRIPDPYGGSMADYRYCLEQIDAALDRLLNE